MEANFTTTDFGFSITRNGVQYEFYSEDEKIIQDWILVLKNVCIMTNFHEEYKALKMIGKGSFAKVRISPLNEAFYNLNIRFIWLNQRQRERIML